MDRIDCVVIGAGVVGLAVARAGAGAAGQGGRQRGGPACAGARGDAFYAEVRKYWPALQDGALNPGYAGIRPKIQAPHEPARDFLIQGPAVHGVAGLVNLFGIESPGLSSSLAMGDYVSRLLSTQ